MPTFTDRATRTLKLQKAERPKIGYGLPPIMDGFEGENRIQMVNGNPRLYYRANNAWYFTGLSQDGTTPDIPTATSTRLGLIKIGSGGTVSSDGTYTATAATPAADDITGGDAAVTISTSSGNITIDAAANDSDVIFKGTDNTSDITMLTLDGSEAGNAIFNANVTVGALLIMPDVTNNKILVSDGTSYQEVALSGDATIANTGAITLAAAQTNITSIYATDLIMGEDSQTAIDFGTANEIDFKADNAARLTLTASALYPVTNNQIDLGTASLEFKNAFFDGTVTSDSFAGPLTGNADSATVATTVTITDNEDTDEDNAIIFTAGGDVDGGNIGLESDGNLIYNPSTGALTAHILRIASASTSRIYVASQVGGTTPSVGVAGQTIISNAGSGSPYWGNPIPLSSGSEGRIQLSNGTTAAVTSSSSFGFGALDASPLVLTYAGNMNITGAFEVKNGATSAGYINFYEDSSYGTNKVTLIGPASTADITLTLPSAAGTIIGTGNLSSITTVGTIGNGTWEGTTVAVDQGGTGATSLNNLITLSTHTTGNYVATLTAGNLIDLQNNSGEGATPTIDVDLSEASEAAIANGDYILFLDGGATGATKKEALADLATLLAGGSLTATNSVISVDSGDFAAADHDQNLATAVTGTLAVGNGGTGATSLTDGGVLLGSGSGAITAMGVLSDGQMIVGDGSTDPVAESGATLRTSIGVGPTAGNTSLVTVGTITTGTWQGTTIAVNQGGTGQTSVTNFKNVLDDETWTFANAVTITDQITLSHASRCDLVFDTGDEDHYIRKDGDYLRFRGHNDDDVLLELRNNSNGSDACSFPTGNLGVKVTDPDVALEVTGAIKASADVTAYSDRRIKKDITTIDNALHTVMGMRGVYYRRKDEGEESSGVEVGQRCVGLIAQEVNEILPEIVRYSEEKDTYSLDYGKTVGVLVEAIKELKSEINEMKGMA